MMPFSESWLVRLWNRRAGANREQPDTRALDIGVRVSEEGPRGRVTIPQSKRPEHLAILGKTGSGKSFLLRRIAASDVAAERGFFYFDLHGDTMPFLLGCIAEREKATGRDLSERLIAIDPTDAEYSVGMNPLGDQPGIGRFVQIAEFSAVLRERWHLDSFGARTDELLRNSLHVLADAGLTILEIAPLLTHAAFRAECLGKLQNPEVRQYFELRFDPLSEAMRAVMREPILNKVSAFTADPHFRHIVGQTRSTFSLVEAVDAGRWIILNLNKGLLGEQSATLGAPFFTGMKNALFARRNRELFTIFADEVQNFVAYGSSIETMFGESRKRGGSIVSANQFLDQYPPAMRAAILSVGTHVFFQLSSSDAQQIATALDGGKTLAERLKNLPKRQLIIKSGHHAPEEAIVPTVPEPTADTASLYARSCARWARRRTDIEQEISNRQSAIRRSSPQALNDWD
jgi:hypothetical protein